MPSTNAVSSPKIAKTRSSHGLGGFGGPSPVPEMYFLLKTSDLRPFHFIHLSDPSPREILLLFATPHPDTLSAILFQVSSFFLFVTVFVGYQCRQNVLFLAIFLKQYPHFQRREIAFSYTIAYFVCCHDFCEMFTSTTVTHALYGCNFGKTRKNGKKTFVLKINIGIGEG